MTARQKRSGAGKETQILGRMSADHIRADQAPVCSTRLSGSQSFPAVGAIND
jgi:hypothetical protein